MKKIIFLTIIIILLFLIHSLADSIYNLWHKHDLLSSAEMQLNEEKRQNLELKKSLSEAENPSFIEREARNKLFLAKPGESSVIIDQSVLSTAVQKKNIQQIQLPNWQQWLSLFF